MAWSNQMWDAATIGGGAPCAVITPAKARGVIVVLEHAPRAIQAAPTSAG